MVDDVGPLQTARVNDWSRQAAKVVVTADRRPIAFGSQHLKCRGLKIFKEDISNGCVCVCVCWSGVALAERLCYLIPPEVVPHGAPLMRPC